MSASTSRPTIKRAAVKRSRPLFHRPDGIPYDFWIQPTLHKDIRKALFNQITDNGGNIWDVKNGDPPSHGFLLIDPNDVSVLHQVKASFHKPVAAAATTFAFRSSVPPTPLRHVLSYQFVDKVVKQGHWGRLDLMHWGWPVFFNSKDEEDMEEALERYYQEIRKNIDKELERGWVWATGSAFYAVDYNYDFKKELAELNDALEKEVEGLKRQGATVPQSKMNKRWIMGRVVAHYRRAHQTKFYLHDDISESAKGELIMTILDEGGACCYDAEDADVILIGSPPDQLEDDDLYITGWLQQQQNQTLRNKDQQRQKLKFVPWVYSCHVLGSISKVDPKLHDVLSDYQKHYPQIQPTQLQADKQTGKSAKQRRSVSVSSPSPGPAPSSSFTSRAKGKQRAVETPRSMVPTSLMRSHPSEQSVSTVQKRRIDAVEPSTPLSLGYSPTKKRKVHQSGSETNRSLDAASTIRKATVYKSKANIPNTANGSYTNAFPGSVSTIKPTRIFDGVSVPALAQQSPLARVTKPVDTSHIVAKPSSFDSSKEDKSDQSQLEVDELDDESIELRPNQPIDARALERERSPDLFDPIPRSRPRTSAVSAASAFTTDSRSSKHDYTTTTNATTLTSRSVGPAPPPNAKQVPRNSTSTGTGTIDLTRSSFGSHGVVDGINSQPSQFSQNASGSGLGSGGLVRSGSLRDTQIDEDDREGEKILEQFDAADLPEVEVHIQTLRYDDDDGVVEELSREGAVAEEAERAEEQTASATRMSLSPWEKATVDLLREMKHWKDIGGIHLINSLHESWPQRLREIQRDENQENAGSTVNEYGLGGGKSQHQKHQGKRKARVSFHEPPEEQDQEESISDGDAAKDRELEEHVKEQERSSSSLLRGLSVRRRPSSPEPEPLPEPTPEFLRTTTSRKSEEAGLGVDIEQKTTENQTKQELAEEKEDSDRGEEAAPASTTEKSTAKAKAKSTSATATKEQTESPKPRGKATKRPTRKQQEQQKKAQESRVKSKEYPSEEEIDELEEDDVLAPLPPPPEPPKPAKKSRTKRGGSVVSDDNTVSPTSIFVPRRGRSASVEPPAASALTSSRKPPSRTTARKTGQNPPRKR